MDRVNNIRLLKLQEILFRQTDDQHELSIDELTEKLSQFFPTSNFDKRTIKRDLQLLDELDFEVILNKGKFGKNLFSHQTRLFETYQLRLIVDAILSARFITTNEKKNLINKVKHLTSEHIAKTLPEPILFSQSVNMDYELVKLNIDRVHYAIANNKVLSYQYGRFNVDKQFQFSREGMVYQVEPYPLIWQNDNYYLIGRFQETNELRHYRLDRIRNIKINEETFKKKEFHLQEYVDHSFHMFAGEEIWIKIRFHNDLVNVVLDRFGLDADIKRVDEKYFVISTKAKLSEGLINWILTWGDKAKLLSPEYLVEQVKEKIAKMNAIYQ